MSQPPSDSNESKPNPKPKSNSNFKFPWNIGVFDAHCHPTDIMASTKKISGMKSRGLTVMSTRREDQGLVEGLVGRFGVLFNSIGDEEDADMERDEDRDDDGDGDVIMDDGGTGRGSRRESKGKTESEFDRKKRNGETGIVPAFGWHPWFSHQMVDDRSPSSLSSRDDQDANMPGLVSGSESREQEQRESNDTIPKQEHYAKVLIPTPKHEDSDFITTLQAPLSLSKFLAETEERLKRFPAALIGEIGLDRGFRLPKGPSSTTTGEDITPGTREGRGLTQYKVNMDHQKIILRAQLDLAAKHKRAVSIHSVQAHGLVYEVLQNMWKGHERLSKREQKRRKDAIGAIIVDTDEDQNENDNNEKSPPYPPRICMHSYSGPADSLRQFLDPKVPADIFFSFSIYVNFGSHNSTKALDTIKAVPEDRILVESDLNAAGEEMDDVLEEIVRKVCEIKGWELVNGVRILRRNWERFVFGDRLRVLD